MADSAGNVALIAGASGLVGSHLLARLLESEDFTRVYAVTRRALKQEHARLANRIVRFETLETQLKGLVCHTAFCCLGEGPGEDSSPRAARFAHVLAFARAAKASQAQRLVMLSCMGADEHSENTRLRIKGEIEQALEALGFASLDILRPGPLLGMRREMGFAALTRTLMMPLVNLALVGAREQYRGIEARTVADAMMGAARSGRRGVYRYTYSGICALAGGKTQQGAARSAAKVG
ncbi:MAG TPA: NAD(P)H-binding protein [Steroidobacteraceae bacterium]|nr:NAD(P)H-binding protein [Steroidobacteraceae bacterium]